MNDRTRSTSISEAEAEAGTHQTQKEEGHGGTTRELSASSTARRHREGSRVPGAICAGGTETGTSGRCQERLDGERDSMTSFSRVGAEFEEAR